MDVQVLNSGTKDAEVCKKARWRCVQATCDSSEKIQFKKRLNEFLTLYPDFKPALKLQKKMKKAIAKMETIIEAAVSGDKDTISGEYEQYSTCFVCDRSCKDFCERCKVIFYCSVECQKLHWVQGKHNRTCKRVVSTAHFLFSFLFLF